MSEFVRHFIAFCIGGFIGWLITEIVKIIYNRRKR